MAGMWFQVLAAGILHFNCLNSGVIMSLPTTTMMQFMSENTTLHRPMTETESSLFGSLSAIGAIVSTPFTGILMERLGRKRSSMIIASILLLTWCMLAISNRVEVVLTASFITGIGGSLFLLVPVYVSEFAEDSIRGALTSGAVLFSGMGGLLNLIIGEYLEYSALVYVCLSMSVLGVALLTIIRESPMFLMKIGMEEEATKSIAFYRNEDPASNRVTQELGEIKRTLIPEPEETAPEEEKLTQGIKEKEPEHSVSCWEFFKKSRSTQRALIIAISMVSCSIFQGMTVVQVYSKPMFSEAIPEEMLSATWCSVIQSAVIVVAGLVTAYLSEVCGRRALMIYSSLASGVCCIALGTQIHLHWGPHWLTAVINYFFAAAYTMGAGTVPFILLVELFLPEVRGVISMLVMEWTWVCNFTTLFGFIPLVGSIGLGPVFYLFAGVCFMSAAYSFYFLPETKGLTVQAIQLLLVPPKKTAIV